MAANDTDILVLHFNAQQSDAMDVVRQAFLQRLKQESNFRNIRDSDNGFQRYVGFDERDETTFRQYVLDVLWELVAQGVIAPGTDKGQPDWKWFHVTDYGKRVLLEPAFDPHDPAEYLRRLEHNVNNPDPTVLTFLREALDCFTRGTLVASVVMLGVAAEQIFLLICDSLLHSLQDENEKKKFDKIRQRNAMKPKLDWVAEKLQRIQTPSRMKNLPEDVDIMILGIYNMIRCQRNEMGHPRSSPPSAARDTVFGYLRIFPSYYATAEKVRAFLHDNPV